MCWHFAGGAGSPRLSWPCQGSKMGSVAFLGGSSAPQYPSDDVFGLCCPPLRTVSDILTLLKPDLDLNSPLHPGQVSAFLPSL